MSSILSKINEDVYCLITEWLENDDAHQFSITCKQLHGFGHEYGYLKSLSFTYTINYRLLAQHYRTLRSLYLHHIDQLELFMPEYPIRLKSLNIVDCGFQTLDPDSACDVDKLSISYGGVTPTYSINLKKFPRINKIKADGCVLKFLNTAHIEK